jgi:hypothetical protein
MSIDEVSFIQANNPEENIISPKHFNMNEFEDIVTLFGVVVRTKWPP